VEKQQFMKTLREKLSKGTPCFGMFFNLGNSLTVEIASRQGLDWVLLDHEHGPGSEETMLQQLQATACGTACPVVRIAWNDPIRAKRALDLGAEGLMFPYVNSAEEALAAVRATRYPPDGVRGVSRFNRASVFGKDFDAILSGEIPPPLVIVQIETVQAVEQVESIAAVPGVDVVFVGPLDLSVSLGVPQQTASEPFREACARVLHAAQAHGKAAGILLPAPDACGDAIKQGFRLLAVGSDGGVVAAAIKELRQTAG